MKLQNKDITWVLLVWICLNWIQGFFTELAHDEAYYWVYSRQLNWGYFDHPPAISLLIKLGYLLIENELGVRLLISLTSAATIWLIWKTIDGEDLKLFLILLLGIPIIHVGGFMAAPDIPLLFFTALFFYSTKQYLANDSWKQVLMISIAIAGMGYSKYAGIVAVFFLFLPNIKLVKRPTFWGIVLLTSLLYLPHLLWQYNNDFPSFRFHLTDRVRSPYRIGYFFNYFIEQFFIIGPLISVVLFYAAFKYKAKNDFERSLKWCLYGIFGFFLLQSLRTRVEANWTATGLIPLLYLSYYFIVQHHKTRTWAYRLMIPSLLLIFIFRIYLVYDFTPTGTIKRDEFHNWDKWATKLSQEAKDLPVIFQNSFQRASKYRFYAGKYAHSVNLYDHSGSQYDLMKGVEERLQGQKVFRVHKEGKQYFLFGQDTIKYDITPDFHYYNRVKIKFDQSTYAVPPDSTVEIPARIINTSNEKVDFTAYDDIPSLEYCLFWYGREQYCTTVSDTLPVKSLGPKESFETKVKVITPKGQGKHWRFRIAIKSGDIAGKNSHFVRLKIEE